MSDLLPTVTYKPAEYDVAERKTVDHESTREDLANFIMEYLYSDVSIRFLLLSLRLNNTR